MFRLQSQTTDETQTYVVKQEKRVVTGFSYGEVYDVIVCERVTLTPSGAMETGEQREILQGFSGEFGSGPDIEVIGTTTTEQ